MGRQATPLSIPEAAVRFLDGIKAERAHKTWIKYRFVLRTFLDYLSAHWPRVQNLGDITSRIVEEYKIHRLQAGKMPATVRADLEVINRLFGWAIRMDYCSDSNPVKRVDAPRPYRKVPRVFSPEELKLIFENAGDRRDFYETLYRSGFRLAEAALIRAGDIDLSHRLICYHNIKGRRDQWDQINRNLYPILRRRAEGKRPQDLIFPEEHRLINGSTHNRILIDFKRMLRRLDIPPATLHNFKHSFVTHLLDSGVHPRVVQRMAHHENLETTLRYARQPGEGQIDGAVDRLPI